MSAITCILDTINKNNNNFESNYKITLKLINPDVYFLY